MRCIQVSTAPPRRHAATHPAKLPPTQPMSPVVHRGADPPRLALAWASPLRGAGSFRIATLPARPYKVLYGSSPLLLHSRVSLPRASGVPCRGTAPPCSERPDGGGKRDCKMETRRRVIQLGREEVPPVTRMFESMAARRSMGHCGSQESWMSRWVTTHFEDASEDKPRYRLVFVHGIPEEDLGRSLADPSGHNQRARAHLLGRPTRRGRAETHIFRT